MKNLVQLILAGLIGGAIAFGAFKVFDKDTVIYEQVPTAQQYQPVSNTQYNFSTDFVTAAEVANPAVVHIEAENKAYRNYGKRQSRSYGGDFWGFGRRRGEQPQAGTGSGVLISEDGYIVTNNHVVGYADFIVVTLNNKKKYDAVKIGTDASTDLAVIKIEGEHLPFLKMEDSDQVKVGEWVVAVGNPFNLASTVTAGIVSAIGRDLDIIQDYKAIEEFIQTDAVVNPGNSGGALVNTKGDLIGINTAISSPTGVYAGYSFAIPSNLVNRVVNEIMESGGDIQRGILGIQVVSVAAAKEEGIDVDVNQGVLVANFNLDRLERKQFSSAEYAGVEIGDVIVGIDKRTVEDYEDLKEGCKFAKIGDTIDVQVVRNGKRKTIPVKLLKEPNQKRF